MTMLMPVPRKSRRATERGNHVQSQWIEMQTARRYAHRLEQGMIETSKMVGVK